MHFLIYSHYAYMYCKSHSLAIHILLQLKAFNSGDDPSLVAGEFGSHSLYKNIGYFSLIGLLRLHCQLGDYHTAQQSVANVQLSKKVL